MKRLPKFSLGAATAAILLIHAESSRADVSGADQKLAQSLFDRARELMAAESYAEACPKFAESQRLDPGGGTLLNLALCHEKEGKLASAWTELNEAFSQALRDGRRDREQIARDHMAAIAPRVPHVVLVVAADAEVEGLEVKLDGLRVRKPGWGAPAAVDPGPHVVEASAPGRKSWRIEVAIVAKGDTARVEIPVLPVDASATPAMPPSSGVTYLPAPAPGPPSVAPPVVAPPPQAGVGGYPVTYASHPFVPSSKPGPAFYPLVATAAVGYGVALLSGVLALNDHADYERECVAARQFCASTVGIDAATTGRTYAWVSTIALGVGVVATVAALVLPRERRSAPAPQGSTQVSILAGSGAWGLVAAGRFQ